MKMTIEKVCIYDRYCDISQKHPHGAASGNSKEATHTCCANCSWEFSRFSCFDLIRSMQRWRPGLLVEQIQGHIGNDELIQTLFGDLH